MANLLALDCTDRACSVAVAVDGEIIEIYLDEQRLHAKHLLGLIADCLDQSGLSKADLDAIVWARGPGSFTGLRIAAACVQGFSYGLGIPAMGVSSLLALALQTPAAGFPKGQKVWVGLDARMGEVYTATWQLNGERQSFVLLEEERLEASASLSLPEDCDVYLGSALHLTDTSELQGIVNAEVQVHAGDLLRLPRHYLDQQLSASKQIEPVYLRRANAWKKMEPA